MEDRNTDNQPIWSSENVYSRDYDESMMLYKSQSDASFDTEHPPGMDCEGQESAPHQDYATPRRHSCSSAHHEAPVAGIGPEYHLRSINRGAQRRSDRCYRLRYCNLDMMAARNSLPGKRPRGSSKMRTDANKTREKKY